METHYSTPAEPPEIRNKLASLQSQKTIIEELTLRLQHAQTEYKRLEMEIKAHRASVAPIQKCPEEVLLMIFHAYTKGNPELVTHLLPICHQWYEIAANAPGLWNVVNIQFNGMWNVKSEAEMAKRKLRTCLKYSASLPLHITFDCQALEPAPSQLNEYMIHCLQKIDPGLDVNYINECIEEDGLDLTHLTTQASMCHPEHAIEFTSELVGTYGDQMKRCKSLEVTLPEDPRLGTRILRRFKWNAPNLAKLSMYGMIALPRADPLATGYGESDLSSLEALELLGGEITDLDFLPLKFDAVKSLTLEAVFVELHESLQLSRFTHLERLVLYCVPGFESTSSDNITLPRLQRLSLVGYSIPSITWNVPVLQRFKFDGYLGQFPGRLPNIQASHVLLMESVLFPITESCLRQILSKYTTMKQLTIPTKLRSIWEELVQELTQKEELPPVLLVVSFAPDEVEDDRYY